MTAEQASGAWPAGRISKREHLNGESPQAAEPTHAGTIIYRPLSYVERLDLAAVFPMAQPLEAELGSGDGSFLVQHARANPDHNFIGVERLLGRLRKLERKALRLGLANLRLLRIEASYFVEYMLPPESVQALHLYFPDPWPKRRHHPRRLVNARFTAAVAKALRSGGTIFLRTDNADYFNQMTDVFGANPNFQSVQTPAGLSSIVTDFERDFLVQGITTLRAAFQRV